MNRLAVARALERLALAYLALILLTFGASRIQLPFLSFGGHTTKVIPYLLALGWGAQWLRAGRVPLDAPLIRSGVAFLLLALVSSVGSPFPYSALQTWLGLVAAFAFYLYLHNLLVTPGETRVLVGAFLAGHLYLCALGLMQDAAGERVHGTFNHFSMMASYLMLTLPALLYLAGRTIGWSRVLLYALAFLSLYLLVRTFSRAALLGVAAGIAVVLLAGSGRPRRVAAAAAVAVLALALSFLPTLRGRFGEIGSELSAPQPLSRVNLWKGTVEMIASHPERLTFGQGWGETFQHELACTHVGWRFPMLSERYTHAHNLYLQLLLVYGVAGLGAFLWMMGDWLRSVWSLRHGPEVFLLAGGVAFLVHACFEVLLTTFNLPLVLFALLALGTGRESKHHNRRPGVLR